MQHCGRCLFVEPLGGLCNRLRVLDSAIYLSLQQKWKLFVYWELNEGLYCEPIRLFETPEQISRYYVNYRHNNLSLKYLNYPLEAIRYKLRRFRSRNVVRHIGDADLKNSPLPLHQFANQNAPISVTTCYPIVESHSSFSWLRPFPVLQERSNSLVQKYRGKTCGVHVRRGDHHLQHKHTNEMFTEKMRKLEADGIKSFFLATDDSHTEAFLCDQFKGRIIVQPKASINRNSRVAIEDAMVDLMCLSKTQLILGSLGSSFSEVAAQIGSVNIEYVGKPAVRP